MTIMTMSLPAEVEDLAVVPDETCPLARVAGGPAEVALLDAHRDTTFASRELLIASGINQHESLRNLLGSNIELKLLT